MASPQLSTSLSSLVDHCNLIAHGATVRSPDFNSCLFCFFSVVLQKVMHSLTRHHVYTCRRTLHQQHISRAIERSRKIKTARMISEISNVRLGWLRAVFIAWKRQVWLQREQKCQLLKSRAFYNWRLKTKRLREARARLAAAQLSSSSSMASSVTSI